MKNKDTRIQGKPYYITVQVPVKGKPPYQVRFFASDTDCAIASAKGIKGLITA